MKKNKNLTSCTSVRFGDFTIQCLSRSEMVSMALADCEQDSTGPLLVFDANGQGLSLAKTNEKYRKDIERADLIHADGGFLVSLSKMMRGHSIPERSGTTDMIHDFAAEFQNRPYSFYLLGGEERVNEKCCENLIRDYPGLNISGRQNGFFSKEQEEMVIEQINAISPEILWVGLGKPYEQEFCARWKHKLNVKWIITCGGCFNFVTGDYSRAPNWMQRLNVEWLHRLATNPKKLFWRYVLTNPHALWIALTEHSSIMVKVPDSIDPVKSPTSSVNQQKTN